jgi:hypothetical protein
MDGNKVVTAVFSQNQYTLTTAVSPTGSGAVDPSGGTYEAGTKVLLRATANEDYTFLQWEGNVTNKFVDETYIFMNEDESVTAVFYTLQYHLNVYPHPSNGGTINLYPSGGKYDPGTTVTLTAQPKTDYTFDHWGCSGDSIHGSTDSQVDITMDEDKTVYAYFTYNSEIILKADFTWYDTDGLGNGTRIQFDASSSSSNIGIRSCSWYIEGNDVPDGSGWDWKTTEDEDISSPRYVTLKIVDYLDNVDYCTKKVEPNKIFIQDPGENGEIDVSNINKFEETSEQENGNYYTSFEKIEDGKDYYVYQIKNKEISNFKIIDISKVNQLKEMINSDYDAIKDMLGLLSYYNFNITIIDEDGTTICSCGATGSSSSLQNTVKRNILLFYSPESAIEDIDDYKPCISQLPYYKKGEILVTVFLGGEPPN